MSSNPNKLEAFNPVKLVEKLPLKIYAVASWGDHFMLSTVSTKSEPNLLVYKVLPGKDFSKPYESKVEKVLKKFTNKPSVELAVVPEQKVFLSLTSDNELLSADLGLFELTHAFPMRMKGVLCFAVDWYSLKCNKANLQLAVAFKKRILLYKYKRDVFVQMHELPVPDAPRSIHWIGQGLIFCIKKDLYHLTLDGESKELFSIGQNRNDPCLLTISRGDKPEILVLKDDKQISLDSSAKPTQPVTLNWSEQPVAIEYVHPYVIGILPSKGIEVRALEQKILVQNIKVAESVKDQIRYISSDKMTIIASQTLVFMLDPRAYDIQVQQLVLQKQFELALELADLIKESEIEHKNRRDEILKRYAFYLFTQFKFEQSLKYYLEIKEDPVHVIGLYPHLLPSEIRFSVTNPLPTTPPTLSGDHLQRGIQCLISYLTQMRYTEQQKFQQAKESNNFNLSDEKTVAARLQLIDTTLLKCYVKTKNNTLIGSLVRLRDNHLHIAESERILRNEDRFKELVDLFNTKGSHPKALELLLQFKSGPSNSPLNGVWPTVDYLQNLTKENIALIFKYSRWVLNSDPVEGLKIFTEEVGDVRNFPRLEVFEHIKDCAPPKAVDYLEHIIYKWSEDNPFFHNSLIILYKDIIENLLPAYLAKNKGRAKLKAGEEPDELGLTRSKLLNFLHYSQHYEPEGLISQFPFDNLFEERALLLGRLGHHGIALAIYAHVLSDPQMAEEYCRKIYDPEKEENREVYLCLVEMYLCPPKMSELGIESNNVSIMRDDEKAMKILQQYHSKIDTAKVLGMLPKDTHIQTIQEFIATVLEERTVHQRTIRLLLNLMITEQLQVQKVRIKEESPYFVIDEDTQCSICGKKLLTSAFARNPAGDIAHLYCHQKLIAESEDY